MSVTLQKGNSMTVAFIQASLGCNESYAQLLAAAPELLEALEEMLTMGGTTSGEWVPFATFRKAEAAIRKAKGEL